MIGLTPDQLHQAFPFHLAWDEGGQIVQVGESLVRVVGVRVGQPITDSFEIRFRGKACAPEDVPWSQDEPVVLSFRCCALRLRGQLLGRHPTLFIGGPIVQSMNDLEQCNLQLSDLSLHDPSGDHLLATEMLRTTLKNSRRFSDRLKQQRKELRVANAAENAAAKARSEFLANMSHEIRTP
ncbi:MAG: hypothetical protein AAFV53_35825, partial [Myxococcota bacterium]